MKEYILIKLKNNKYYIIINKLKVDNKDYVLTVEALYDGNIINDIFEIFIYNETNNTFDEIKNDEEYKIIEDLFCKSLNNKLIELNILKDINMEDLIKLKIKDINNKKYTLEYIDDVLEKYIEFYTNTKPEIGDYIYLSKNLLNEVLLSYGYIMNFNELYTDTILILEKDKTKIYYRRYYG